MPLAEPLVDRGQCIVCFEPTSEKIPCENCDEYCCAECVQTTVSTSSESCRTGICFVCRNRQLDDVVINVRNENNTEEERPPNAVVSWLYQRLNNNRCL